MAVTPAEILAISEDMEAIYQRTVDDLLVNIARHFNISGWERTRYWEIKKLSEMGALTKESAAIIARDTGMALEEVERAFLEVSKKACLDIDPQLKDAAAKGILQDPGTSPVTSPMMRQMVQGYVAQAADTLNMVNSTMLESTIRAYQQAIQTAVNEAMVQEAKEIVQAGALEVVTGQETRVRAIRKAMDQMARAGIPGFYDSRGRAWSPDGYVAMVIRTTSHKAAIEATRIRQQEYGGGDIFQVSSHSGARPLCYPYQGKFFSWSTGPGQFEDGAGRMQHYDNINDSSYGEPAGLFGINCGHRPIPMIPGYSYPQEYEEQSPEENKKEYEESQKQRQYERQVREAKRELEIAKATGDEDAIKAAKQKVGREQAKVRDYTKQTGRVRRYDREQIGSTAGNDYGMRDLRWQKVDEDLGPAAEKVKKTSIMDRDYKEATSEEYLDLGKSLRKQVSAEDQAQIEKHEKPDGSPGGYAKTHNYRYINTNLRHGRDIDTGVYDDDDIKTIQALRGAIRANKLDKDYVVNRYVNASYLTQEFGVQQVGFKGVQEPINDMILQFSNTRKRAPAITEALQEQVGKTHSDSGFLSASMIPDKNIMKDKAVLIRLHAPEGTPAYIPKNRKESEIIFGENTQRLIGKIFFDDELDKWVIEEYIVG